MGLFIVAALVTQGDTEEVQCVGEQVRNGQRCRREMDSTVVVCNHKRASACRNLNAEGRVHGHVDGGPRERHTSGGLRYPRQVRQGAGNVDRDQRAGVAKLGLPGAVGKALAGRRAGSRIHEISRAVADGHVAGLRRREKRHHANLNQPEVTRRCAQRLSAWG